MRFRLVHLLYFNVIVALFFTMRAWWIISEEDSIAGLTPIVLAVVCGVSAGMARYKYSTIFCLAAAVAASASIAFALECFFESSATDFLRRDYIAELIFQGHLSSSVVFYLTIAFVTTCIATLIGGMAGAGVRFAVCRKRH